MLRPRKHAAIAKLAALPPVNENEAALAVMPKVTDPDAERLKPAWLGATRVKAPAAGVDYRIEKTSLEMEQIPMTRLLRRG